MLKWPFSKPEPRLPPQEQLAKNMSRKPQIVASAVKPIFDRIADACSNVEYTSMECDVDHAIMSIEFYLERLKKQKVAAEQQRDDLKRKVEEAEARRAAVNKPVNNGS